MISFTCVNCGKGLEVRAVHAGKMAVCPGCKADVLVPSRDLESLPVAETTAVAARPVKMRRYPRAAVVFGLMRALMWLCFIVAVFVAVVAVGTGSGGWPTVAIVIALIANGIGAFLLGTFFEMLADVGESLAAIRDK